MPTTGRCCRPTSRRGCWRMSIPTGARSASLSAGMIPAETARRDVAALMPGNPGPLTDLQVKSGNQLIWFPDFLRVSNRTMTAFTPAMSPSWNRSLTSIPAALTSLLGEEGPPSPCTLDACPLRLSFYPASVAPWHRSGATTRGQGRRTGGERLVPAAPAAPSPATWGA